MPLRVLCSSLAALSIFGLCACARAGSGAHATASPTSSEAVMRQGEKIYARECAACHGTAGAGGQIGPSLKNERARRSYGAVQVLVRDPQPPMPKLYPSRLTANEVNEVSAYVESL